MALPTDDEMRALASALLARGRDDPATGGAQSSVPEIAAHLGWSERKTRRALRELARAVPSVELEPSPWAFWRRRWPDEH